MMLPKKFLVMILTMSVFSGIVCFASAVVVDSLIATVSSAHGTEYVTQSDVNRPTLMGQFRTLDDIVFEKAVMLDAKKHNVHIDDAMVEQYLAAIQQAHGLTRSQIQDMFEEAGYTYNEGLEQLRVVQVVNTMLQMKVVEQIIIPEEALHEYYAAHPEFQEQSYELQHYLATEDEGKLYERDRTAIPFGSSFFINEPELAEERGFIRTMKPFEIVELRENPGEIEYFKLVASHEKQLVPFELRRNEIVAELQQEKYKTLLNTYRNAVLQNVSIVYLQ